LANHKSAIKRAKQNEIRRLRNKAVKTHVKGAVKEMRATASDASKEDALKSLNSTKSTIDKAAKKGVLHKKTAARKISRLEKLVNSSAA
jgi:small subunit ribosomal protein S20